MAKLPQLVALVLETDVDVSETPPPPPPEMLIVAIPTLESAVIVLIPDPVKLMVVIAEPTVPASSVIPIPEMTPVSCEPSPINVEIPVVEPRVDPAPREN